MAELRTELKTEMRDLTTGQTRTMMLGPTGTRARSQVGLVTRISNDTALAELS